MKETYYSRNKNKITEQRKIYYQENKEKLKAKIVKYKLENANKIKKWRKEHIKENIENYRIQWKKYRDSHKEQAKLYAITHPNERRKYALKWASTNSVKFRQMKVISVANRRLRLKGVEGKYSIHDVSRMLSHQNGLCVICSKDLSLGYHVDHVIPIARGGSNWPENLQLLCPPCNLRKHTMTMEEFKARMELLNEAKR